MRCLGPTQLSNKSAAGSKPNPDSESPKVWRCMDPVFWFRTEVRTGGGLYHYVWQLQNSLQLLLLPVSKTGGGWTRHKLVRLCLHSPPFLVIITLLFLTHCAPGEKATKAKAQLPNTRFSDLAEQTGKEPGVGSLTTLPAQPHSTTCFYTSCLCNPHPLPLLNPQGSGSAPSCKFSACKPGPEC